MPCQAPADDDLDTKDAIKRRYRTHILVLELLAAVCLVSKGHGRILEAFDNFKMVRQGESSVDRSPVS